MNLRQRNRTLRLIAVLVVSVGLSLHALAAIVDSETQGWGLSIALLTWAWLPYLIAVILIFTIRRAVIPLGGALAPLAVDILNLYALYVSPESSTGALNLLWMPLWNILVVEPLGLFFGWVMATWKGPTSLDAG